jgi:hypothetical protein
MLLIDDLLLAPFHGLLWVCEKVHDAAQEEMAQEADAITEELRQLYMMLETGRISEAEFDEQERKLLDRLDAIRAREAQASGEEDVAITDEPVPDPDHDPETVPEDDTEDGE